MAALIIDEEENEEQTLDSIRVFDSEERGYFSTEELKTALKRMPGSSQMTDSELRDILRKADPDNDGKIDIQGTRLISNKELLKEMLVINELILG